MKKIVVLIFIILVALVFNGLGQVKELKGLVKDVDGKPLERVKLYHPNFTETDANGEFSFNGNYNTLFLFKENYKPKLIEVDLTKPVIIVLEEDNNPIQLNIKECSQNQAKKRGWFDFIVEVPKGYKKKQGSDIDYGYFNLYKKKDKNKVSIKGMSGSLAGSVIPNKELLKKTKEINIRSIYNNNYSFAVGFDFWGTTKDGIYWRKIRFFDDDHIYYSVKSEETKNEFDEIINNSCSNLARYKK